MQVVTNYPDGIVCWVDLATKDTEAAKAFYSALFGWKVQDIENDGEIIYTMFQIEGKNVAAVATMDSNMQDQGIPAFWTSYIKHSDVDSIAAKTAEAGGNVMFPPFDVMDSGRMTMIQDPTGAMLGVWQPQNHIGAELVNRPNTLVWNELQTRDTEDALAFYSSVFGWTGDEDENEYVTYVQNGRRHAGMLKMDESFGDAPPNWNIYFSVEDVAAIVAKAQELGGTIHVPPTQAGEVGKFAVVQDPTGGVFSVIELAGPADAPPGY